MDIGAYDTCTSGCTDCYATTNWAQAALRLRAHDPHAPMLTGYPAGGELITDRTTQSQKNHQLSFWKA